MISTKIRTTPTTTRRARTRLFPVDWNESTQSLTIGGHTGSYPGMVQSRKFNVVFVGENRGVGGEITAAADRTIDYSGAAISVQAK